MRSRDSMTRTARIVTRLRVWLGTATEFPSHESPGVRLVEMIPDAPMECSMEAATRPEMPACRSEISGCVYALIRGSWGAGVEGRCLRQSL